MVEAESAKIVARRMKRVTGSSGWCCRTLEQATCQQPNRALPRRCACASRDRTKAALRRCTCGGQLSAAADHEPDRRDAEQDHAADVAAALAAARVVARGVVAAV